MREAEKRVLEWCRRRNAGRPGYVMRGEPPACLIFNVAKSSAPRFDGATWEDVEDALERHDRARAGRP